MAIGKQFDEEMGYAASRELPPAVAQYMKATGKSEEQVAKEIINEDPEWLDWTTHTKHPGNSTPEDNGWTDLKKLGLGIGRSVSDSWMNHRNNTDPMWRVGLVNAIFGDPSMLGQYYQMQNQNAENEKNRQAQNEYNNYWKELERQDKLIAEDNEKDKRLQAAKVEYAKMLKELQTAGPADQVIINAQISQLLKEYPDIDRAVEVDGNMVNPMLSKATKAAEDEREYQKKLAVFTGKLPTSFKTNDEKTKEIAKIMGDASIRDTDKQAIAKELRAIKSEEQITAEATAAARASAVTKPIGDRASALNEYNTLMAKKFKTTEEENKIAALKKQWGF